MWSKWLSVAMIGAGMGAGFANVAAASHGPMQDYVYARVVSATPIVRHVVVERPRQECWRDEVVNTRYTPDAALRVAGATLAGGLIGGAIGHELGHGHDRDTLAVVGSFVGSALANQAAGQRELARPGALVEEAIPVEHCRTVTERVSEERIEGYLVTYRHHGRNYSTRMREQPGSRIRLEVRHAGYGF